jgi:Right handed beta helix region
MFSELATRSTQMNPAKRKWIWLVTLSVSVFTGAALATDVTVGCPGGQPGQFASITAALNSLNPFGPHRITVTGTCTESLFIADRDGVTITAPDSQTATVNAANPSDVVIFFFRAHRMLLNGLVIQGGSTGVIVATGSDALINNCTIQNNSGDGLHPQQNATLVVENSTLQKNGGTGLTVASDSNVTLSTFPTQRIHINDNGFAGINVDGGYFQVNFGTVTIENNKGPAPIFVLS